jgi:isocitrate dehydrogenase
VVARDPNRPKAADIPDKDMLAACDHWTATGYPYPTDAFLLRFPRNVILSKLAKLHRRGWIDAKRYLTKAGRDALQIARDLADIDEASA